MAFILHTELQMWRPQEAASTCFLASIMAYRLKTACAFWSQCNTCSKNQEPKDFKGSHCDNALLHNGVECHLIFSKALSEAFCLFSFARKPYLLLELRSWKANLSKDLNPNWCVSRNLWPAVVFWWLIANYIGEWYLTPQDSPFCH